MEARSPFVARIVFASLLSVCIAPSFAVAQNPLDHLQCHKVADSSKFKFADVALTAAEPSFQVPAGCTVKGKAKELCIPTSKTVIDTDAPVPPLSPVVDPAAASYVCYKMKCPKLTVADTLITDQFGERDLQKIKTAGKLCVPIAHGVVTTTTTSSTTSTTAPIICTADVKVCPDGTVLVRDPLDNCNFPRCPGECSQDADCRVYPSFCIETPCECLATGEIDPDPTCDNGTVICIEDPCVVTPSQAVCGVSGFCEAQPIFCTADVKQCSDGSVVGRDPANNCEFERCPGDCDTDQDCRVYGSVCAETACQCLATGVSDPDPTCQNGTVVCLQDPCVVTPSTPTCVTGVCAAVPD